MDPTRRPAAVRLCLDGTSRTPEAVRRARHALDELAELQEHESIAFNARLLISELVANAVTHGTAGNTDPVEIRAEVTDHRLRVQISDGGAGFVLGEQAAEPDGATTSGRGLYLVRVIADRFGIEDHRPGGHVWFELDL